ncbi:LOW QUALITY PROTEIN: conserved hypothetical protein, partial [Streptomyces sp. e14]
SPPPARAATSRPTPGWAPRCAGPDTTWPSPPPAPSPPSSKRPDWSSAPCPPTRPGAAAARAGVNSCVPPPRSSPIWGRASPTRRPRARTCCCSRPPRPRSAGTWPRPPASPASACTSNRPPRPGTSRPSSRAPAPWAASATAWPDAFALRMADRVYTRAVTELRQRLELPPLSPSAMRRRRERADWPVLHGFSTALVPRPADWRPGLEVVGNWWPHHDPAAQLPPQLEDFLRSGPRPVLITFGSMAAGEGERLSEIAVRALRRAGLRGILQTGSAGLAAESDDVRTIGDVPHALLFPQLAAVVHHAGAGTTAAALRAAVPAVTVPVTADQPFWARRLAAIGAAPDPVPFAELTAERLADALGRAVRRPEYTEAAARGALHMAAEDGAGHTLKAVEQLALQ